MALRHRILLINDDVVISQYLSEELIAKGGYDVHFTSTALTGLESFKQGNFDITIVKLGMPDLDSAEMGRNFKRIDPDCVVVGFIDESSPQRADHISGFYDFITKPINPEKLLLIVKKGIELHTIMQANRKFASGLQEHNTSLIKQNSILARRVEESTKNLSRLYEDLRSTYLHTVKAFAQAIDARDHYTHSHSQNVAKYAVAIAEQMQLLPKDIEIIREACELHDLGKIGVQDSVLGKPSALTDEEWLQIRRHPQNAVQILESLPFLNGVIDLIKQHHEHYNGSGYPDGLSRDGILLGARIIHLADAYEAMRTARPYRKIPLSKDAAVAEITKNTGTQFDPKVVEAFLKVVDKIESL